jgi:hypothetical protein
MNQAHSTLVSSFECYSFFKVLYDKYSDIENESSYIPGDEQVVFLHHLIIYPLVLNTPCG